MAIFWFMMQIAMIVGFFAAAARQRVAHPQGLEGKDAAGRSGTNARGDGTR